MDKRNKEILKIALPSIVSNITVPLLGLVDVAIVGHLGAAAYIGAIAVGGMMFNVMYWIFGFLRMGTSGMTSQALGRRDFREVTRLLARSLGIAFAVAAALILLQKPLLAAALEGVWRRDDMRRFFSVNRDIFLRTLCMVSVMLFFTSAGSWQGEVMLAVNTLLMQFYLLFSYVMDGFAYAGEALSGRYFGARNAAALRDTVRHLFRWGLAMAAAFTLVYGIGGDAFLSLLTDEPSVVAASHTYYYWALAIPLAGMASFVWDGIFIGCTMTRGMLVSMAAAAATFFAVYFMAHGHFANHGLWAAFIMFVSMRGIVQFFIYSRQVTS